MNWYKIAQSNRLNRLDFAFALLRFDESKNPKYLYEAYPSLTDEELKRFYKMPSNKVQQLAYYLLTTSSVSRQHTHNQTPIYKDHDSDPSWDNIIKLVEEN